MRIRHLVASDVSLIARIDRSEHVDVQYAVRDGQLVEAPVFMEDIPTWPDDGGEHSITKMLEFCTPIVEGGATLLGAFTDDDELAGLAIVDPTFEPPLAWLALLHVSRPHRRTGAATALWAEAARLAIGAGAAAMYVSATPTGSAVGSTSAESVASPIRCTPCSSSTSPRTSTSSASCGSPSCAGSRAGLVPFLGLAILAGQERIFGELDDHLEGGAATRIEDLQCVRGRDPK